VGSGVENEAELKSCVLEDGCPSHHSLFHLCLGYSECFNPWLPPAVAAPGCNPAKKVERGPGEELQNRVLKCLDWAFQH
jgi:hypothetical protein